MKDKTLTESLSETVEHNASAAADLAHRLLRDEIEELLGRLIRPSLMVIGVVLFGIFGFKYFGDPNWTWFDCIYMTTITMTTVGFSELPGMPESARVFAIGLMWTSVIVMVYATSTVTAFIVEEHIGQLFALRRIEKVISKMKDHYILCGAGNTGIHVLNELVATKRDVVVIEQNQEICAKLRETHPDVPVLSEDALTEEALYMAGIDRCAGLITTLPEDGHNMIVVLNARYLAPKLKIATRCIEYPLISRYQRAGADYVISPNFIGGMRIVSEMVRPNVVGFLDKVTRGRDATRVEEVVVGAGSDLDGQTLGTSRIREVTGLQAVAVSSDGDGSYTYNPSPEVPLKEGTIIVAIGQPDQFVKLRAMSVARA